MQQMAVNTEIVKSLVEVQRLTVYGVSSHIWDICITYVPTRLRDHQGRQNRKAVRAGGGNWGEKCLLEMMGLTY